MDLDFSFVDSSKKAFQSKASSRFLLLAQFERPKHLWTLLAYMGFETVEMSKCMNACVQRSRSLCSRQPAPTDSLAFPWSGELMPCDHCMGHDDQRVSVVSSDWWMSISSSEFLSPLIPLTLWACKARVDAQVRQSEAEPSAGPNFFRASNPGDTR